MCGNDCSDSTTKEDSGSTKNNSDSSNQSNIVPSKVLVNVFGKMIWLDSYFSSTDNLSLLAVEDGTWEVALTDTEIPAYSKVWMDFSTNQGKDKNVINGLVEMILNQTSNSSSTTDNLLVIMWAGSPIFPTMLQSSFLESKLRKVSIVSIRFERRRN